MMPRQAKYLIYLLILTAAFSGKVEAKNPKRIKVKTVEFRNNQAFSGRILKRVMLNRPSTLFLPVYYNESLLKEDLKQLELYYHQNGYLDAFIESHRVTLDSVKRRAYIEIALSEGELTMVEGISVFGNTVFTDSLLLGSIDIAVGAPLKQRKLDNSIRKLINLYADKGYIEAGVNNEVQVNSESHRAVVDFVIAEGEQYSINRIKIEGAKKTRVGVVKRELLFKPGQVINYSSLLKSQRNLYMTGLFKSVYIHPLPSEEEGLKNILVELKETTYREFAVSLGYGSIERVRSKVEVSNTNILGASRKIGLSAKISFIGRGIETTFTEPRTFNTYWKTDVSLKTEFLEEPGYDIYRYGGRVSSGRILFERINAILTFRYENLNLRNIQAAYWDSEMNTRIRSVSSSMIRDTRNNLFNASKGSYIEFTNEFAGLVFNGTNAFLRSSVKIKKFFPIQSSYVFGSALELGWMESRAGGIDNIPLNERFYTGGPNSIRGFKYQMAGPLDENRIPLGGRLKAVVNVFEIRRTLYKMLGGALFLDAGNVWSRPDRFTIKSIRYSPGLGLRLETPIGLARVDYGFNPDRRKGEGMGMLYFSIGQAF